MRCYELVKVEEMLAGEGCGGGVGVSGDPGVGAWERRFSFAFDFG